MESLTQNQANHADVTLVINKTLKQGASQNEH